jgi:glycosyltransferase involved in cell wall biosynthesis
MNKILINGLNARAGGGKSILNNYLKILTEKDTINKYFVLTPQREDYIKYESKNVMIIDVKNKYKKTFILPFTYAVILPKLIQKLEINLIFNLADIPIRANEFQVFLFDWPYAVYPNSIVWSKMSFKDWLTRKIKLFIFKKNLHFVNQMIAQNEAIRKRLFKYYNIKNIKIVNNSVSLDNLKKSKENTKSFNLPKGTKLLYLTHYYPHKNLEVLLPLANLIKSKGLEYKIIITIENDHSRKAYELLNKIESLNLNDIIINIGSVDMKNVPSLYQQCHGLLMPTLLESFSGTYVEAMYHGLPILTSDLDFAKVVCENSAIYFNPLDENDIFEKILKVFTNNKLKKEMIEAGGRQLKKLSTWDEAYSNYQNIIFKND